MNSSKHSDKQGQARPKFDWPKLSKAIEFYDKERLCYLPAGWGHKNPSVKWEQFQTRAPTPEENAEWFHEGRATNIGVLGGAPSGGLVVLCFNDQNGAVEFFGKEQWRGLLASTHVTKSSRGHHVWLRSNTPIKSQFVRKGGNESWLEIRSDGSFVVAPPSLHPSGVVYQAIGTNSIYKPAGLDSFIDERLSQMGLKALASPLKGETKRGKGTKGGERSDEFNALAVEKLLESCSFIQYCRDNASILSEPWWWSLVHILAVFGNPGREKIHELSAPYPEYTEEETEQKIKGALKAAGKEIGPHTCLFIEGDLGFDCPEDCLAKKWGVKSPAGLARRLSSQFPDIIVNNRQLRDITSEILQILEKANQPAFLFVRAGVLTRITWNEDGYPIIGVVNEPALRGYMTRTANFIRVQNKKEETEVTAVPPPLDVVRDILSLGQWSLPPLQGIIQAPVIREDGTIFSEPGYDAATKLYYAPTLQLSIPQIPDSPTKQDALQAMAFLLEVVCDFPFDSDASKANALAAMITPILRPLIPGKVPMGLFDKPQPGTGASLLAEVIDTIATGRSSAISPLKDDESWRKEIASILLRGQRVVIIDNVEDKLNAASLGSLLTSDYWEFRILGGNVEVAIPHRCTWIATGNNIRVGGDLPRRCYWVRVDAKQARPWERDPNQFTHPRLTKWVQEERGRIIAAILTIGRAWYIDGQPLGKKTLGSYEEWAAVIGGILDYVGVSGFLDNLNLMYEITDVDTPQWEEFLAAWYTLFGAEPVTVAEVVKALNGYEDFAGRLPDTLVDWHKGKSGKEATGFTRRLGKALSKRNGVRYPNGFFLQRCGEHHRAVCWKVDNSDREGAESSEFNEFGEFPPPLHTENSDKNNLYKTKGENSQNSQNSPLSPVALHLPDDRVVNWQWCLSVWSRLGKPVIHVGDRDNILDLSVYRYPEKLSPQRLQGIVAWLEEHSKEKMPQPSDDIPWLQDK